MDRAVLKPFLIYTVLRFAVFAVLLAVLWLIGVHGFLGIFAALLLSLPAAFVLLRRQREALTRALALRVSSRRQSKSELRARLRGDEPAS